MIENRPAIDATETFTAQEENSHWAMQWAGRYTTLHTGNHRQLDASGNDMQHIASQATTARNAPNILAPIEVAPTARQHTGKTKQANIYDGTALIDN